jgi:hypothetical protein
MRKAGKYYRYGMRECSCGIQQVCMLEITNESEKRHAKNIESKHR